MMRRANGELDVVRIIARSVGRLMANDPIVQATTMGDLVMAIVAVAQEVAKVGDINFARSLISYLPGAIDSEESAIEVVRLAYTAHRTVMATSHGPRQE